MKIAILGLGEAGSLIAADMASSNSSARGRGSAGAISVVGFDPAAVKTPDGVTRVDDPSLAVADADYVLALTAAADARTALEQAFSSIPSHAVYADFASASSELKQELAGLADSRNIRFCDVALMAIIPGNGIKAPALLSGPGAAPFAEMISTFGMPVDVVSKQAGDAAQRKLLRSVAMKGLAAVLIEALQGAHAAGCAPWLWQNLCDEIGQADSIVLERLVLGTQTHARRRLHEMKASQEQLEGLSVTPIMTAATVANLETVMLNGVPDIPDINSA